MSSDARLLLNFNHHINTDLSAKCRTELWSNQDDTQTFVAQVVNLTKGLSNFDEYEIEYRFGTRYMTLCANVSRDTVISYNQEYNYFRQVNVASNTSITFDNAYAVATYGTGTMANNYLIPSKIYGIKY